MHILLVRQALQPFLPSKRRFLQAFASEFLCNTARDDGPYGRLSGEPRENDDPARVTSAAGCANGGNVRGEEPSVVRLMGQMVPHQRNAAPRETCRDIRENRKDMDGKPPSRRTYCPPAGEFLCIRRPAREGAQPSSASFL